MDFFSLIKTRRSIRSFKKKAVDRESIKKIIEMATYAPSACNVQGWRFIVIDDEEKKQQIVDLGGSLNIKKAPLGILVLYDNRTENTQYADHIQSAAAGIQNLLLAAHHLGLDACWICHLPTQKQLRKLFKIPSSLSPIAYIMIGHKKGEPSAMPRKHNLNELISFNVFSSKTPLAATNPLGLFASRALIKIYSRVPAFIKRQWLNQYLDKRFVKKFKN